jgi:hypothetical protein
MHLSLARPPVAVVLMLHEWCRKDIGCLTRWDIGYLSNIEILQMPDAPEARMHYTVEWNG